MNIQLSLKKQWFEMTDTDGKTEDYRTINEYWMKRLFTKETFEQYLNAKYSGGNEFESSHCDIIYAEYKPFTHNIMTLGYPKSTDISRIKIFEHAGIEIGFGKEEWGAEPNKLYFIIKHGKRIQ
jgi:hypothetical protein